MLTINQMTAALLESLTQQIRAAGKQDNYCSLTVQPGNAVVFDFGPESGCGGIAWVRLISANPSVAFPSADVSLDSCAFSLAFTVEMGMVGPAPVLENTLGQFTPPDDIELFDASMRQMDEMQMMYDALKAARIPQKIIGSYAPQGPEAGVMGGVWTVTVGGED
jgi:hypothetical protein